VRHATRITLKRICTIQSHQEEKSSANTSPSWSGSER